MHECIYFQEWSLTEESPIRYETIVKFQVKMSGIITCVACNEVGCETAREVIFVSGECLETIFLRDFG